MKYQSNIEKAEGIRSKYFADVVSSLDMAGAETVKAFAGIAERFGEEGMKGLIAEQQSEFSNIMAPTEANERLQEVLRNTDHPYWQAGDPDHARAVEKVTNLTKMANPPKTAA